MKTLNYFDKEIMDAKFKRGDTVYLNVDPGKEPQTKYKIIEYYLGDIPKDSGKPVSRKTDKILSDHNYRIEPINGGEAKVVNENDLKGIAK